MGIFVAFAVGYVLGARTGSRDLDQLREAIAALRESDEFADLVSAARSHASHTLHEIANMVERGDTPDIDTDDLVGRVRQLFGRSGTVT